MEAANLGAVDGLAALDRPVARARLADLPSDRSRHRTSQPLERLA